MTIGIVAVAALAACVGCPPVASRRKNYELRRSTAIAAAPSIHAIRTPSAM